MITGMKSAKTASLKYLETVLKEAGSSPLYPRFREIKEKRPGGMISPLGA
jgi:hypothetical protein